MMIDLILGGALRGSNDERHPLRDAVIRLRDDAVRPTYFPLLVNFFTATRNSSVCMQSMMASRLGVELLLDRRHVRA